MKKEANETSRRSFIKGTTGGLAGAVITDLTPLTKAFQARVNIDREKEIINCTIGEATSQLMNNSITTPPDLAAIYRKKGGSNDFSIQLLAETFGSRSLGRQGSFVLALGKPPDFNKLSVALIQKARIAAENKLPASSPTGRILRGVALTVIKKGQSVPADSVYAIGDISGNTVTVNCGAAAAT